MLQKSTQGAAMRLLITLLIFAAFAPLCLSATPHAHAAQAKARRAVNNSYSINTTQEAGYVCPMHPEVTSKRAGKCPKCEMKLIKREVPARDAAPPKNATGATAPDDGSATPLIIPDAEVLDQNGKPLKFYRDLVKGRTVAINFIFTTCTAVCPSLTAKFRQLQQELELRQSGAHLISITVDPATDIPERLKSYAAKFKAGPGWTFVTGSKPEIDALLSALGAASPDKTGHPSTALILNDTAGYRTRASALAPVATLVNLVVEAAAKTPLQTATAPPPPGTQAANPASAAKGGEAGRVNASEASAKYFPNHILRTQDNKPMRFYDGLLKGKVVLINFMFTTCAGVCSPMTANLLKVQSYLGERVGREVSMLSISVDPLTDTPDVLKAFAAKHKTGPGWYFLTGKKENVDWVLYKLGGFTEDRAQHSSVLIIGNEATGEWIKTHAMANPSEIAEAVVKLIGRSGK